MKKFNFMPLIMAILLTSMSIFILTSCGKDDDNDPVNTDQSGNQGSSNSDHNSGNGDSGNDNSGNGDTGNGDTGNGNTGNGDSGNDNSGNGNSGNGDSGSGNLTPPTPEPTSSKLPIGGKSTTGKNAFQETLSNKFSVAVYDVKYVKFENNTKETETIYTKRLTSDEAEYPIFTLISDDTLKICTTADKIIMPENCENMFNEKFKNLEKVLNTKILDMSNVTSFEKMFSSCTSLQEIEGIETWNVEKVENFSSMFYACTKLIEINIENWKVTNKAKDLSFMFSQCGVEKLNLEKWNTESVETMENMFYISKIKTFIGKGWNTLKCNNFNNIFEKTTIEELDLSNWEINEKVDKSTLSLISGSQSIHITCSKEIQSIIKVYLAGATWTLVD